MSHYAVLKLAPDAPSEVIRAAYRVLASRHHPDRCGGGPGAVSRMQRVNEAYRVLSDPELRAAHDASIGTACAPSWPAEPRTVASLRVLQEASPDTADAACVRRRYAAGQYLAHARL